MNNKDALAVGQIIKSRTTNKFTIVPNSLLKNKELSLRAKGLMSFLLSLSDNFVIYKVALNKFSKEGRDATLTAFKELVDHGYIVEVCIRDEKGQFKGYNYITYDEPVKDESHNLRNSDWSDRLTEKPFSDKPFSGNPPLHNTVLNKTLNLLNKETIKEEIILPFKSEQFLSQWQKWKDYKRIEKNFRFKSPISENTSLKELYKLSNQSEDTAIKIIDQSIAAGYTGLFALKSNGKEKAYTTLSIK